MLDILNGTEDNTIFQQKREQNNQFSRVICFVRNSILLLLSNFKTIGFKISVSMHCKVNH